MATTALLDRLARMKFPRSRLARVLVGFCMATGAFNAQAQVCNFSNAGHRLVEPEFAPMYPVVGLQLDFGTQVATMQSRVAAIFDCSNSEVACYSSNFSTLALPRERVEVGDEWAVDRFSYRRGEDLVLPRLGREERYSVVIQAWDKSRIHFLLNRERFLAGIVTVAPDGVVREMWLEQDECRPFRGYEWLGSEPSGDS
jgi:hypothetical protein